MTTIDWDSFGVSESEITSLFKRIHDPSISKEDLAKEYDNWAKSYEQLLVTWDFNAPSMVASKLAEVLQDRTARVLDLGAGTGIVGSKMKEHGFSRMDGLDGSPQMLELARLKNVYDNLICAFIEENKQLPIDDNVYSALVISAGMSPGHISGACFPEMARIVKPGGFIVMAVDELYFSDPVFAKSFEEPLAALQQNGTASLLQRKIEPNYCRDLNGVMIVLKVN